MHYFILMIVVLNLISPSYAMEYNYGNKRSDNLNNYPTFPEWVTGKKSNAIKDPKTREATSYASPSKEQETVVNNRILRLPQEDFYLLLNNSNLHPDEKHTIKMWYLTPLDKRGKEAVRYFELGEGNRDELPFICNNQKFVQYKDILEQLKSPYKQLFTPEGMKQLK